MRNVNYSQGQKQLKNVLNLKSTSARPPIYDREYPELPSTASPGNPVGINQEAQFTFIVCAQFLEESTTEKETYFLTTFGYKSMGKIRSQSNLASKLTAHCVHIA